MPYSTKRASETELNQLHRLTVRSLVTELRRLEKKKEPTPAALLNAAIKLLAVTGSTTPDRPAKRNDRLAGLLKEFEDAPDPHPGEVDFSKGREDQPARQFPGD